jgi:SAM-dependent MidA family methyltransferase
MTFAQFMALALYHPTLGYYRRPRPRIGYGPETDFFTASTSGPVFGELIAAACVDLLGGADPREFTFIEIGAEPAPAEGRTGPGGGVLTGVDHPFAGVRTLGVGESPALAGRCIVFSNELFDAQPFHRFVFRRGAWRELGVACAEGGLALVELAHATPAPLPDSAIEGYVIDAPLAARTLAGRIAAGPWSGLFVAADYGKSWRELTEATPAGTARAYFRHTQSNDLLARPGEQDLTCHICWDWLAAELERHGFVPAPIESQEAFFIRHAGRFIARASAEDAARFSRRKLSLLQLLHPTHLGQKFQILFARRFA